jgi:predicted nucleotidyltransferase component of viral defense system
MPIRLHEEDPVLFGEAINFTAAETGFIARLIEKDYFCSVLLEYLSTTPAAITFKGGTLLAKVHSGFYRLSEDLDFSISSNESDTRASRSNAVAPVKSMIASVPKTLPVFGVDEALAGSNSSKQYNAVLSYKSVLADQRETIKVEIGIREPTMTDVYSGRANTLLLNPIRGRAFVDTFAITSLSFAEAMAEKIRAALCRREVAIRDFFDVDHAVLAGALNTTDASQLELLRRKVEVPGTGPINLSPERRAQLQLQMDAQLRPVLRPREFEQFDLDRAFGTVADFAKAIGLVASGATT